MYDNGAMKIKTIDDGKVSFVVNGHRLKLYHRPTSKEYFLHLMSTDKAKLTDVASNGWAKLTDR
jgi:hypothetical protein